MGGKSKLTAYERHILQPDIAVIANQDQYPSF